MYLIISMFICNTRMNTGASLCTVHAVHRLGITLYMQTMHAVANTTTSRCVCMPMHVCKSLHACSRVGCCIMVKICWCLLTVCMCNCVGCMYFNLFKPLSLTNLIVWQKYIHCGMDGHDVASKFCS